MMFSKSKISPFATFVFCLVSVFSPLVSVAEPTNAIANTSAACNKIDSIEIESNEPFSKSGNRYAKAVTDFLHYKTRDHVIKKELLFRTGECLDVSKLEETERNLRAMNIFSRASVQYELDEQTHLAKVRVVTEDQFTFRFEISASQAGGVGKNRFSIGDKNMLGLNKELHYSHSSYTDDASVDRYVYKDSRFFKRYAFQGTYSSEDGKTMEYYSIEKPFRTLSDANSYGLSSTSSDLNVKYSLDGGESVSLPRFFESASVFHSWQLGDEVKSRILRLQLSRTNESFFDDQDTGGVDVPERVELVDLDLGFQFKNRTQFLKLKNVDSILVDEDIELARGFELGLGAQDRQDAFSKNTHPKLSLALSDTEFFANKYLQSFKLEGKIRSHDGEIKDREINAFYHGYYFIGGDQSLVGGLTYQYRKALDAFVLPYTLGGDMGLRGFDAGEFTGNKKALINFEYRGHCLYKSHSGAVCPTFFVDAGNAWKRDEPARFEGMHVNAGFGFRIGIPALLGHNVLRIDFAAPIHSGKASVTAVVGQVFEYDTITESQVKSF